MKKNSLSLIAIVLSIVSIAISIVALQKINHLTGGTNSDDVYQQQDQVDNTKETPQFDSSVVGDWSGTDNPSTVIRMRILDDSTIIIEDPQAKNSNSTNLYLGHIEDTLVIIEKRSTINFETQIDKIRNGHEYVVGELIDEYLGNPESFELDEYYYASHLSKLNENTIIVGYGVGSSQGDVFVTFVRK